MTTVRNPVRFAESIDDDASDTRHPPARRIRHGTPTIAVASLETRYRQELLGDVVPFWEQLVFGRPSDPPRDGGHRPGHVVRPESLQTLGHAIWLYSRLYNRCRAHPHWRESAAAIVHVALRDGRHEDGGREVMAWLGLAEGLQEYAEAALSVECRLLARELVLRAAAAPATAVRSPLERAGLLVLIGTEMLSRRADDGIEKAVESAVEAVFGSHLNETTGLLEEQPRAPCSGPGITVFGRSLETLWAIMREARRRGDDTLAETCVAMIRRHVDVGWDRIYGGLAHAVRVNAGAFLWPTEQSSADELDLRYVGEYHYMKTTWALATLVTAMLEAVSWRREPWAVDAFGRAQDVLDRHFPLRELGPRRYAVCSGRQMPTVPSSAGPWMPGCPRQLVAALELLARIRATGRRTL